MYMIWDVLIVYLSEIRKKLILIQSNNFMGFIWTVLWMLRIFQIYESKHECSLRLFDKLVNFNIV